jgi:hypothetical protein
MVVLEEGVQLPDRIEPQVELVAGPVRKTLVEQFAHVIGTVRDLPPDMAEQHDHYIHATAKRFP